MQKALDRVEKYKIYDDEKINEDKVLKMWENLESYFKQNQNCSIDDANRIIEMIQSQAPFSGSDLIYELTDTLQKCAQYPTFPKLKFSLVEHPGWQNFMDSAYHAGQSLMDTDVFYSPYEPFQDVNKFIQSLEVVGLIQLSHKMYLLYILFWAKEKYIQLATILKVEALLNQDEAFDMYEDSYYWGSVENWQQLVTKE
jgi:hypothetical protein